MPSSPPNTHTHTLFFLYLTAYCIQYSIFWLLSAPPPPHPLQALHSMFLPQPLPVAVLQLQRVRIGELGVAASSLQGEVSSVQCQTELTLVLSVGGIIMLNGSGPRSTTWKGLVRSLVFWLTDILILFPLCPSNSP